MAERVEVKRLPFLREDGSRLQLLGPEFRKAFKEAKAENPGSSISWHCEPPGCWTGDVVFTRPWVAPP